MSKSLKRVRAALDAFGLPGTIEQTPLARTAQDAALAIGCHVDQIAKSIVFADADQKAVLFLTAGGNQVDLQKAAALAGSDLQKADAALIRSQTGFAIGGVSPVGHVSPVRCWMDPKLAGFDQIWAAAGTPHHVFSCTPEKLQQISGAQIADFAQ